jgi:single-strand DNA-binding protein
MNSINLIGRLTRDPELRSTAGGKPVCSMRIAVNDGADRPPTYVDVVTFDRQASACAEHLSKGRQVGVSGRLSYSEWKAEDSSPRSKHEVIGRVQFLGKPTEFDADAAVSAEEGGKPVPVGAMEPDDSDIPF